MRGFLWFTVCATTCIARLVWVPFDSLVASVGWPREKRSHGCNLALADQGRKMNETTRSTWLDHSLFAWSQEGTDGDILLDGWMY